MNPKPIEVFLAYSYRDESLRDELEIHLRNLKRQGIFRISSDREITAGSEWVGEIDAHINTAQIILLLISPDFLASDYSYDMELKRALARHEAGEVVVVPIILRPVDWQNSPFSKLQALPKNLRPLTRWRNRDEAFLNIVKGIQEVALSIRVDPITSSPPLKRVLILASNPKVSTRLQLEEEVREINEGLLRSRGRDRFIVAQRWAVRPKDIRRAILEVQPNIVHFSNFSAEAYLSFEDDTGQNKLMSNDALADLFNLFSDQVECVLLNACYSGAQAAAIAQHIDYVIGMPMGIGDRASIVFSIGFYDALANGRSFEFAYRLGLNAIQMEGIPEHLTPILLRRKERQVLDQFLKVTEQFLKQANATFLEQAVSMFDEDKRSLQIVSLPGRLKSYDPLPVLLVAEQPTDQDVVKLKNQSTQLSGNPTNGAGIILYVEPPDAVFQMRMAEVRLRDHFVLIPIPFAELEKAVLEGNASSGLMASYADRYLPGADLFDDRNAIGDTLSFFGRSKLLHDLENDLQRGQGIGLFGLRKSGKTSLLLQLGSALRKHPVVHIDLQPYGGKPYFGAELFNKIIQQLNKFLISQNPDSTKSLKLLSQDVCAVSATTLFIKQVEELAQGLEQSNFKMPIIVFLDEIERIFPFDTDSNQKVEEFNAFFGALRELSQAQKKVSLLVADVHPDCNRINNWKQQGVATNPVFQFFKEIFVAPFTPDETKIMLTNIGRLMGREFDASTISAIHQKSGGYPFVARQLASLICSKMVVQEERSIRLSDVQEYLEDMPSESATLRSYLRESIWNDLEKRQDSLIISNSKVSMSILRILACNEEINLGISQETLLSKVRQNFTKDECFDAILWLEAVGLVAKSYTGNSLDSKRRPDYKYQIQMPLLTRWLRDSMTDNQIAQWKI